MATAEMLEESAVTVENLEAIFTRAFIGVSKDSDGDLVLQADGPRTVLTINTNCKAIRFTAVYGMKEDALLGLKHEFVNKMNDNVIMARFSVPGARSDVLICDYYLPYEQGVPAFQVIASFRLFSKVVPSAIRSNDTNNVMG